MQPLRFDPGLVAPAQDVRSIVNEGFGLGAMSLAQVEGFAPAQGV